MKTIALNRLGILAIAKGEGLNKQHQLVLLSELAAMGYRVTNPELLNEVSATFLLDYKHFMEVLAKKKGGNVKYVPLFLKFPNDVPDDAAYFAKRIIGHISHTFDLYPDSVTLDNGTKVPKWLFDINDFGADPIYQMQSKELWEKAVAANANKKSDTHTEWHDITIMHDEDMLEALQTYLQQMVYAKSSIKEELHQDLMKMLDYFGAEVIDSSQIVFKETQALVLKYFWNKGDWDAVKQLAKTATDILRLFAALTGSDVSLSQKIKFPKLNRAARRTVLAVLEKSGSLGEDLRKYKGLWIEIGRYLHPTEYAKQYPRTAKLFDLLRNGKIETYGSKTEKLLVMKELDQLLQHLERKPGVFARKLHEVLRRFPEEIATILASFEKNIDQLALKNLLVLESYFATINEQEYRSVINKRGKMKVLNNNAFAALTELELDKILVVLRKAIRKQLSTRESWAEKIVWMDPRLANYTVPLQQRKASDGIITVGRGTRIDTEFAKVLRLFVYWEDGTKTTDLDLSVIQYNEDFQYLGHVSYTNLADAGIVHSGDIQSAPEGAAEFIDITLTELQEQVKYLAIQISRYCGDHFMDMTGHAGWMWREKATNEYKTFDIKTVANKFDLNGKGGYAIPLLVDIANKQIISTDLYVAGVQFHNNVEGSQSDVSLMCLELSNFVQTRPVMQALAEYHVTAREATLTEYRENADITFGLDNDCTYNALNIEQVLSELI